MTEAVRKQRRTTSKNVDETKPASIIVDQKFNGLSHFCALTGYPTSAVFYWKTVGYIPPLYKRNPTYSHILDVAKKAKIALRHADFFDPA